MPSSRDVEINSVTACVQSPPVSPVNEASVALSSPIAVILIASRSAPVVVTLRGITVSVLLPPVLAPSVKLVNATFLKENILAITRSTKLVPLVVIAKVPDSVPSENL